jgi:GNAT superfamily N-acetyltransferase
MTFTVHPLTPDRWGDLERLFGPNGASGGCWCMWNRQSSREYEQHHGADNHAAMAEIVAAGPPPGLLAYDGDDPVGWVAVGPREDYGRLQRSPVAKPVDDTPAWIVHCFVVGRRHRGRGVAQRLLEAAVAYAAAQGAATVEGCPVDPPQDRVDAGSAWHGLASMFEKAGFVEIARRSETRPLMREVLDTGS